MWSRCGVQGLGSYHIILCAGVRPISESHSVWNDEGGQAGSLHELGYHFYYYYWFRSRGVHSYQMCYGRPNEL